LQQADPALEDYLAIGRALRKSRQFDEAIFFFEAALLKFPENREALLECAHAYLDLDKKHVAAHLFERASVYDPQLAVETAEVHRRAKQYLRALYWNSQIGDQQEKIKQRLAILVELEEYGKVAAMKDSIYRVQLVEDDHVAYAMAYSHFKLGDYENAEAYLKSVDGPEVFDKATRLRKAMTDCQDAKWLCY
jgi:tetratricopeptide (TPR) repeat protein